MSKPKHVLHPAFGFGVVLSYECDRCSGHGNAYQESESGVKEVLCPDCEGLGYLVTQNGMQVLGIVKDILLKQKSTNG